MTGYINFELSGNDKRNDKKGYIIMTDSFTDIFLFYQKKNSTNIGNNYSATLRFKKNPLGGCIF
jgi:hypothetical protein